MNIVNIDLELKEALIDDATGVKLVKITGDFNISVYAAEIAPKTELNPHYHKVGIETYQVLEGCGVMKVGEYEDNAVRWTDSFEVRKGDCFTITSPKVHQIINTTDQNLKTIFTCPSDHLEQDRYFI